MIPHRSFTLPKLGRTWALAFTDALEIKWPSSFRRLTHAPNVLSGLSGGAHCPPFPTCLSCRCAHGHTGDGFVAELVFHTEGELPTSLLREVSDISAVLDGQRLTHHVSWAVWSSGTRTGGWAVDCHRGGTLPWHLARNLAPHGAGWHPVPHCGAGSGMPDGFSTTTDNIGYPLCYFPLCV